MADSDDDYDRRKGRDKFRRERNDYDRRDERRRDTWEDRSRQSVRSREILYNSRNNRDRREMYGGREAYDNRRRRFSPPHEMGHQVKRMRRDWDDAYQHYDMPYSGRGGGPGHMSMGGGVGGHGRHPWGHGAAPDIGGAPQHPDFSVNSGPNRNDPDYPTQPPMLTFKQFLTQQDDTISEEDAIKRYNEYKQDFKRQQISEFFLAHKEEEWFKSKFHPEESAKRQDEVKGSLQSRLAVFQELLETSRLDTLMLDVDRQDEILKVLDAAVIRMEGGTDLDLTILDEPQPPEKEEGTRSRTVSENVPAEKPPPPTVPEEKPEKEEEPPAPVEEEAAEKPQEKPAEEKVPDKPLEMAITPEQEELQRKAREYQQQQKEQKRRGKRKKTNREKSEYSYESESESESGSDSDLEPAPPGVDDEPLPPGVETAAATSATPPPAPAAAATPPTPAAAAAAPETAAATNANGGPAEEGKESPVKKEAESKEKEEGETDEKDVNTKPEEEEAPRPRPLHRTNSIFLRNLAPTITKQEVEALCKRYPGFMRVALQDPQPERRFFRRGWATYSKSVNIKDICWNLNNIRLRDCELGATLNRELKQRVRPVNGLTVHKTIARNDIKLAARITQNLDRKWGLWLEEEEEKKDKEKEIMFSFVSKNPVLHNITDYLVEEGSFEEDELLGTSEDDRKDVNNEVVVERDETLLKVLDRMIMYLRVVHSLDYYSANEYPNEDEMPHRCGIMHARGMAPGLTSKFKQNDVVEYMNNFETKLKPFLEGSGTVTEEEAIRLGKKSPEIEVEKFVQANTQELAKDKWLCPLSGKKFKGPDFVRKHVFNKHGEKVEEVKKEVAFFNNYLMDPKRPSLPEHPGNRPPPPPREGNQFPVGGSNVPGTTASQPPTSLMGSFGNRNPPVMYGGSMPSFGGGPGYGRDGPEFGRRGGGGGGRPYGRRSDPRPIIEYRDLDAPDEMDIF